MRSEMAVFECTSGCVTAKNRGTCIYLTQLFRTPLSKLSQFKVIQGQSLWWQLKAHWWVPIWPLSSPTLYLSSYSRNLIRKSY